MSVTCFLPVTILAIISTLAPQSMQHVQRCIMLHELYLFFHSLSAWQVARGRLQLSRVQSVGSVCNAVRHCLCALASAQL